MVFEDHGVPWGAVARNLDVTVSKLGEYRGQARFTGGTISIQKYEPMAADLAASFKIVGPRILFDRIDIKSDGAQSSATGAIDVSRWPEQTYNVKSRIQFPRMREIFFARDTFSLSGEGDFTGTYHLFKGGRELKGNFTSVEARRECLSLPQARGLADLDVRSLRGDARDVGFLWRQDGVSLRDGAAGQAGTRAGAIRRRLHRCRSQPS